MSCNAETGILEHEFGKLRERICMSYCTVEMMACKEGIFLTQIACVCEESYCTRHESCRSVLYAPLHYRNSVCRRYDVVCVCLYQKVMWEIGLCSACLYRAMLL